MLTAYIKSIAIMLCFTGLDVVWWRAIDRRIRALRRPSTWRLLLGLFMVVMIAYVGISIFYAAPLRKSQGPVPIVIHTVAYLWHFITLPLATIAICIGPALRWMFRIKKREPLKGTRASTEGPSRRQMIAAAAMAVPPLANGALALGACKSAYGYRLRSFALRIPSLPPALDGMTIAHVSDTHIGKFLHPDRLPDIADAVNRLDADFVVFTGDLIDVALDDLPYGIDFLRKLKSRCGMAICEGNHDLFQDRGIFEQSLREANLPIIIGDQITLPYTSRAGRSYPVRFLGTPWNVSDDAMYASVDFLRPQLATDAFPILLAHHPHSFDAATRAQFPLTLSGHTHGGQIMLTRDFGAGSVRFRYTSGLYQKGDANLIVNNGLGNWFPLRIKAPAELVHITLRNV